MGILSAFRLVDAATRLDPQLAHPSGRYRTGSTSASTGIRSPWTTTTLQKVVFADLLDAAVLPMTRAEAMTVPAVAKGRHLICPTLARHPLRVFEGATMLPAADQPRWLDSTATATHPNTRMLWTLDDLVFNGWALWAVRRETPGDAASEILDAIRVPPEWWSFDDGDVLVSGEPVDAADVILFPGPFEGLCEAAATVLRGARLIDRAWVARVRNPVPMVELHQTTDEQLTDDEIDELVADWTTARNDEAGAVAFTPHNVEARAHGAEGASALFVEGRNAVRLDVANFLGLPASLLDGSTSTASLTYSTTEGRRNEFVDYGLGMWSDAIESRLSLDDVVAPGRRMAFDLAAFLDPNQPPTSPARED